MSVIRGRILVYSIIGCPHCLRAKNRLAEAGLPYTDVSLDRFPQVREDVKKLTGKTTVPQIFFNERYIGGNAELQNVFKSAEWPKLLEYVQKNEAPAGAPQPPDPKTAVDYGKSDEFVCEPDEYAALVHDMKKCDIIKDHTSIIRNYKSSFKGQDLIDWLMKTKHIDKQHAMDIGQELISRNFGHDIKGKKLETFQPDQYYRLLEDDDSHALNAGAMSDCVPVSASELGENLRRLILKVYSSGLSKDGKTLDYKAIKKDPQFVKYVDLIKELQRTEIANGSRNEKLAFFINIYNALVIHASIKYGPPTNIWQRYKFFNTSCYIIGGQIYSLQDIENGVLRGNKKGVGMFSKPFKTSDPRLKVALSEGEPLIHFALNCGAKSCPPIKTFSAKGVQGELKVAAEAFFESDDALKLDETKNEIKLSQIFKWYIADFGGTSEKTVEFIGQRLVDSEKKTQFMKVKNSGKYKVTYLPYDWGHNSKD